MTTFSLVSTASVLATALAVPNVVWRLVSAAQAVATTAVDQPHEQNDQGQVDAQKVPWSDFAP